MFVKILFEISAVIATPSKVAEPVTPEVVIPAPVVPTVIAPEELLDGVIDEKVWEEKFSKYLNE